MLGKKLINLGGKEKQVTESSILYDGQKSPHRQGVPLNRDLRAERELAPRGSLRAKWPRDRE